MGLGSLFNAPRELVFDHFGIYPQDMFWLFSGVGVEEFWFEGMYGRVRMKQ